MKLTQPCVSRCLRAAATSAVLAALPPLSMAQIWTHVAAACTPDESSLSKFDASAARFRHKGTNTGAIYARCNVVNPMDAGASNPVWTWLELVFKDTGEGGRVRAQLYRVSNSTGGTWLMGTVDSDSHPGSAGAQTRGAWLATSHFDFEDYAYYVLLTVERTNTAVLPDATIVRLYQMIE